MKEVVDEVAATRMTANTQCKNRAAAGLCSSIPTLEGRNFSLSQAYGVVVFLAQNSENGRIPSLAISCFTNERIEC